MLNGKKPACSLKPGPGARALYLDGRSHKRVTSTEAALVVTNERAQVMRFPVARVARVVSRADVVDWSGAALGLCMRAGIGITWIDTSGQAVGSIYSQSRPAMSLTTALELWCEHPDGEVRYQNWLRARRMDTLVRWGKKNAKVINPQQWEAAKRDFVYGGHVTAHLPGPLRGLCLAYVASQLNGCGLPPRLWGPRLEALDLDVDLCQLLWAEMNLTAGILTDNVTDTATATALFERWSTRNASALTAHLTHLQRIALKAMHC